ncbi:uncharacterized protein LOC129920150 [Episyrphus balteatus]|uniref:uncharacterized protein LOC129920150 n=1 Tax=Episyrphus balteatus TaxID=286459 RepID=UPI0024856DD6|nr:uncharacterized protein LOC129920150 [Episyrphus balteatus]XP_055857348.1 uncharacterized protein LOC129920150 [Episyrphus balteatus]
MDPVCEKKYNFLQKYVPFLANLIKLLANDNEKQGKLAQMQLLYDLLNKPDNSVQIETLEKCEEVLCRVFGNTDEKLATAVEWVMPSPFIKAELPEEVDESMEKVEDANWENLNGSIELKNDGESTCTNEPELSSKNSIETEEGGQTYNSETEHSKQEFFDKDNSKKDNSQERMLSKSNSVEEEQNKDIISDKFNDVAAKKESEDINDTAESSAVKQINVNDSKSEQDTEDINDTAESSVVKKINVNDSKSEQDTENEAKLSNEHETEVETQNSKKIPEKTNDNQVTKENIPEVVDLKSNSIINKSESVETTKETPPKSELEKDNTTENIIMPSSNKKDSNEFNEVETNIETEKGLSMSNNEKQVSQNESEPMPPCVEIKEDTNDTVNAVKTVQTCEKPPDDFNEKPNLISNESDSNILCEKTSSTCEAIPKSDENLHSEQQKISLCVDNEVEASGSDKIRTDNQRESLALEQTKKKDVIEQSQTEMLKLKIVSAESLAATDTTPNDVEEKRDSPEIQSNDTANEITTTSEPQKDVLDPLDPLSHVTETRLETNKTAENGSTSPKMQNKDDDDDDVLLVENRSSPICIDSDPEDEENMKGNRSFPVISSNLPPKQKLLLSKPTVRKSTAAVMETIRNIISKNQNITPKRKPPIQKKPTNSRDVAFVNKDPKALMETIDLLDSDSDDERPKHNSKQSQTNTKADDDVIIVSSTHPQRKFLAKKLNQTVPSPKQIPRFHSKVINKSPAKPATAQSNFLNAVNLQPAKSSSSNPATFSARLSNKKVIIPNAFYGNPSYNRKPSLSSNSSAPSKVNSGNHDVSTSNVSSLTPPTRAVGVYSGVSIRHVQDKVLKEWLEGFLTNFASPLQIASHACFVLLQRVLKYRFFQRLKETRIFLNQAAKNCSAESVDVQMLLDLRNVFLENDYLTEAGRRFCRFATNDAFGKPVALTTDSRTGRVTCRTRVASKGDLPTNIARIPNSSFIRSPKPITPDKAAASTAQLPASTPTTTAFNSKPFVNSTKICPLPSTSTPSSVPKRRGKFRKLSDGLVVAEKDEDDNDYTPAHDEIEPEAEIVTERKRSLRTNRTKRKEAGFTYSEDHDDEEFEAIARKIENKKREELRLAEERELELEREQLEQQRKMNKKTVAKKTTSKRSGGQADNPKGPTRKKLRLANTSIVGSEENDLLTPTWIEADADDGEVDSLLDFADEPQSPGIDTNTYLETDNADENSFQNDETIEEASQEPSETFDLQTDKTLKNIDRNQHLHNKTHDFCVHCQRRVPRIVHHYVNEHRSSEVFPSRLRNRDIRRLLTTSNVGFVHLYKGNQIQYAAHCIFCDKEAKFLLPYWFEHFTMHTGEYSFKCSGCHILKPTRSLLTNHIQSNSGCPKKGSAIRLVNFDTKVHQIEAHICSICNYTQLHRKNLLRHLRTQHGLDTISPDQIIKVVLLQISAPNQDAAKNEEPQLAFLQHSDDEDNGINNVSLDENSLMLQHDFTDNDDLSFMICGMLDVQTNLSPTG